MVGQMISDYADNVHPNHMNDRRWLRLMEAVGAAQITEDPRPKPEVDSMQKKRRKLYVRSSSPAASDNHFPWFVSIHYKDRD
jgi:hypothetical protein